jgi:SPP1 family phage portal protein
MDSSDIKKKKESLDKKHACYKSNFAYANGKNPTILTEPVKKDPDNRIPIPLAKTAVSDMSGYAGRAGDTTVKILDDGTTEAEREEYEKLLLSITAHNKTDLETAELYEEALTQGVAYELFWTSDDLKLKTVTPEYKIVSALEIVPIFTSSLKPELSHAIRFWKVGDVEYADVYEPLFVTHYIKSKSEEEYKLDPSKGKDSITEYPYKTVPLAIYPINRHAVSLFDAEKPIIDAHDDLISKSTNEIDRFNAMKLLMPGLVTKEMADKISSMGIFQNLGDDKKSWPEYLEKNLGGIETFYNALADRLERLFHKSIKIPDMTAESFAGGAQSGVAIAYKLIGMEFKASQIDTHFDQGINKRIELINDVLETSYTYVNDIKIKITHKRNLPIDESAKVEQALKLKGNISDEAYLRMFPRSIVPNVQEELDRLELEPDRQQVELYVLAMQAGKPVPAKMMAEALRIDPAEWLKMSADEQKARIDALSKEDDNIEQELNKETELVDGE